MRTSTKKMSVGLIATAFIAAAGYILFPEIIFAKAKTQYRMGMSATEVQRSLGEDLQLTGSGVVEPPDAVEYTKRRGYYYYARIQRKYLYLQFNYYKEIVGIRKDTPLARLVENLSPGRR